MLSGPVEAEEALDDDVSVGAAIASAIEHPARTTKRDVKSCGMIDRVLRQQKNVPNKLRKLNRIGRTLNR